MIQSDYNQSKYCHPPTTATSEHKEMAIQVASKLINDFSVFEQNDFLILLKSKIEEHRNNEIERLQKAIHEIQEASKQI